MKPVIENLQSELYQLENKQAKGANFVATLEAEGEKCPKTFFEVLERQNMRNQQYLNYMLMIINQNILAILRTFLNLQKNYETLHLVNFHSCYY